MARPLGTLLGTSLASSSNSSVVLLWLLLPLLLLRLVVLPWLSEVAKDRRRVAKL